MLAAKRCLLHGFVLLSICASSFGRDLYDPIVPKVVSTVRRLTPAAAIELLRNVCASVKEEPDERTAAYRCIPPMDPRVRDAVPTFDGVIYGHFLNYDSEDAAVSGWAGEGHPQFFGGTLLLTKIGGAWQPVWYRSSVITRHCRRTVLKSGRDILVCEEEDGGMGHKFDILYTVDFENPKRPWDATLFVADSFRIYCDIEQRQIIDRITFDSANDRRDSGFTLVVLQARRRLSERDRDLCADGKASAPPTLIPYRLEFNLGVRGYSLSSRSSANAKLTAQKSSNEFLKTGRSW